MEVSMRLSLRKELLLTGQKNKYLTFVASHTCTVTSNSKVKSQNSKVIVNAFTFEF
jgi:hypothetical protein